MSEKEKKNRGKMKKENKREKRMKGSEWINKEPRRKKGEEKKGTEDMKGGKKM